nr:unnamed protein product [Digitaria exilis]
MVSVSQAFDAGKDMRGLLARLLPQIMVRVKQHDTTETNNMLEEEATGTSRANQQELDIDHMDVEQLSTKLKDLLKEKRYLVVIDDVWSLPAWEAIRIILPENNCGSRIIVTTRIETVAKASSVSEDLVHHMKPLEREAGEELFVKRVFGSMGTCPDGLKDTMGKILKKCGGLPLAIVKIASILASYNSVENIDMWIRVSDSIGSRMENHPTLEGMRQVITLSYAYLPHHLKACMMYLSIFPEDYVIAKDRLLYRWIAEGLVAEKRGLTLFDVAEEYFNELISRNMIQKDKLLMHNLSSNDEMVEACRVHDMMLEVMVSISQEANFVTLVGRQYGGGLARGTVRRLSVHDSNEEEEALKHTVGSPKRKKERVSHGGIEAMKLQHARSLSTFQVEGLDKLLDRLGEFRLLRVAQEIGELQQLQMLSMKVSEWDNDKAPKEEFLHAIGSSLSKTYALRTLILTSESTVRRESALDFLLHVSSPPPLLRCLSMSGRISRFPDWISSLKHLVELTVWWTQFEVDQLLDPLCMLPNLQILRLGHRSCGFAQLVVSTRHKFPALRILELLSHEYHMGIEFKEGSMTNLERLVVKPVNVETSSNIIIGFDNLKKLKEVKLICEAREDPWLKHVVQQLKEENENRPKSNQIKVLVE